MLASPKVLASMCRLGCRLDSGRLLLLVLVRVLVRKWDLDSGLQLVMQLLLVWAKELGWVSQCWLGLGLVYR